MRASIVKYCLEMLLILSAIASWSSTAAAVDVPTYDVYEVELTASGVYTNPYLQMPGDNVTPGFVVGVFAGPDAREIRVDGFWDGGSTWRIRFAPMVAGEWTYETESSDAGLDGVTGSFTAVPSDSHGFVEVDPDHPHHFRWQDGTPFYYASTSEILESFIGTTTTWSVDDNSLQGMLDQRRAQGFGGIFWGFFGFRKPTFNNRTQRNEGGLPFTNYNPDLLNPVYHQYGDLRIRAVDERSMLAMISLGWPDQGIGTNIGHTRLKRHWRYLIARYGAYNVVWNLFGEGAEWPDAVNVVADYGALTKTWDPYNHLATVHTPPPGSESQSWMDFITLQTWIPGQSTTARTADYLHFGKPVVNSEYGGYEATDQVSSALELRRMIWDIMMHGGYYVYEIWSTDLNTQGAQGCRHLNWFFRNYTRFWLLEYHPELFGNRAGIASPGEEYVIYLPAGGSVTVDLSAASEPLEAAWYNPRTGEMGTVQTVNPGSETFTAPGTDDWVLHVRVAAPPEPAPPWGLRVE